MESEIKSNMKKTVTVMEWKKEPRKHYTGKMGKKNKLKRQRK